VDVCDSLSCAWITKSGFSGRQHGLGKCMCGVLYRILCITKAKGGQQEMVLMQHAPIVAFSSLFGCICGFLRPSAHCED